MRRTQSMGNIPYSGSDTTRPASTSAYRRKPTMMSSKAVPIDTIGLYSALKQGYVNQPKGTKKDFASNTEYISEAAKIKENLTNLKLKEIEAAKKAKEDYLNSPLYKNRFNRYYPNLVFQNSAANSAAINSAAMSGVSMPNNLIQDRLQALKNVDVELSSTKASQAIPEQNRIIYNVNDPKSTFTHELSHITGASAKTRPMSRMESNEFLIRNKNLKANPTLQTAAMKGEYNPNTDESNTHDISPIESKSDIDALRGLLKDNGITQKFGQNIDINTLQRALQNKKIAGDKHTIRLLKNFEKKDIVELNNIIAKQEQVANENLA